ncbi:hypothetical protein FB451DRAFT_1549415 [Mycena latifolia]|nr:hypothetical protein FB451DRAFT_1549415 [Mycena latifolia]
MLEFKGVSEKSYVGLGAGMGMCSTTSTSKDLECGVSAAHPFNGVNRRPEKCARPCAAVAPLYSLDEEKIPDQGPRKSAPFGALWRRRSWRAEITDQGPRKIRVTRHLVAELFARRVVAFLWDDLRAAASPLDPLDEEKTLDQGPRAHSWVPCGAVARPACRSSDEQWRSRLLETPSNSETGTRPLLVPMPTTQSVKHTYGASAQRRDACISDIFDGASGARG